MSRQWENKLHFGGNYSLYQSCGEMSVYKNPEFDHLTFNPDEYANEASMWEDIAILQKMLLRSGNVIRVRQEEQLVIVEWTYDNSREYFGGTHLEFLTEDEIDLIDRMRQEDCGAIQDALKPKLIESE